ncbi:RidA family protein [Nocardiopsis sp. MG754419]|uniref:RidA family protein n=1 Tax=Nocardiopsis sp. MG754419 TaxID=2259865 RepID=UPI001BA75A7A|nr:RidA family protein [Nocardiopsis sp. MG754419]MBR8745392.1 RidA family protein [Nocardiopsis sp. MG754419]
MAKPYSDALVADGPLLFVSGQSPEASDGDIALDITGQTRQIFQNLTEILGRHGADLEHVVKLTSYLRHVTDLDEFRAALDACLPGEHRPAATLVEVSGLVHPRYLVEVDAVACLPKERG